MFSSTSTIRPRHRRPFTYRSDVDEDLSDLDETEQTDLINTLATTSQSTDAIYIRIFTILPLACIPAYLYYLFSSRSGASVRTLCLLSITSLLGSSLGMYLYPHPRQIGDGHGDGEDEDYELDDVAGVRRDEVRTKRKVMSAVVANVPVVGELDSDGPLGRVLPFLNPGICALLALAGWVVQRSGPSRGNVPDGFWLFLLLPGVILAVTSFARRSMTEVQEGLGELKAMKYGYKGA